MHLTRFGSFDGRSWENLCQLVFKRKYQIDGYQQIPADPGDFGLEGFCLKTGMAFQCYCPEKNYNSKELYEAQRDKITTDLGKLKKYQAEIRERIGDLKIVDWVFVSPTIEKNALLSHIRSKEAEVRGWGLSIIDENFTIHIRDIDFYAAEINEVRAADGVAYVFDDHPAVLDELDRDVSSYEENILRKSRARLTSFETTSDIERLTSELYRSTQMSFIEGDSHLRRIERDAPTLYFRLVRLINEYVLEVKEKSLTWAGTAEELTEHVKVGLQGAIYNDLNPSIDESTARKIARQVVARWIAVCQLDFKG